MAQNKHVYLINEKADNPKFSRQRGRKSNDAQQTVEPPEPKFIKDFQKEKLRNDTATLYTQRKNRNENRSIQFPKVIDLVRIYFFTVFNHDLNTKFNERYGLSPVEYSHFNKTVTFEIVNEQLFKNFENHINEVINSPDDTSYENKSFNLIALILRFEFINTRLRLLTSRETGILLTLISSANNVYGIQKETLFTYLQEQGLTITYNEQFPDIIEIKNVSRDQNKYIADNFDIVRLITSARTLNIRPGVYGTVRREFGFTVTVPDNIINIGVIDTGINRIEPLRDVIINNSYDHTGTGAFWDEAGHGTAVAGLIVLGDDFHKEIKDNYTAKAKVLSIKALHHTTDDINIPQLLTDIRDAKMRYGIRLFNMSLNLPIAKKYNDTYSQFAYELDKLAYEEDILIFLSVGNFDADSLEELLTRDMHPDHEYPTFFYNLNSTSQVHSCQNTNISEPSESLNNISVGALAGNLEDGDNSDVTPLNIYPAYYSRKFHLDYTQPINNTALQKNQSNKHLNKPDLVFDGGDFFNYDAGIEVLRSPLAEDEKYFGRTSGTSLATPLITSYAADILNLYPTLKTQTVKALLINSASFFKRNNLPAFRESTDKTLKSIVGFGKPEKSKLLFTDDNSIVFIIEDKIEIGQILTIPILLPEYLKETGNKLKFDISLCYSFMPLKDNHLNYLPLYMSFNLVKNQEIKIIATTEQSAYGIKSSFSWSEDHHGIDNRIFSNAQFQSYNLQPNDLNAVGDSIALGVRCLAKNEIPESHYTYINKSHEFSIVLTISEIPTNNATGKLYSDMIAVNEIRTIAEVSGEADVELEAQP